MSARVRQIVSGFASYRRALALLVAASALVAPGTLNAQEAQAGRPASLNAAEARAPQRLLWLRASPPQHSEVEQRIERALGRYFAERGFSVSLSPMPFSDVQLAAGCVGGVSACGPRIASVLDNQQLAVSAFEPGPSADAVTLRVYLFVDGRLASTGAAQVPRAPAEELELTVRALTESLFGAEPIEQSAPRIEPSSPLIEQSSPRIEQSPSPSEQSPSPNERAVQESEPAAAQPRPAPAQAVSKAAASEPRESSSRKAVLLGVGGTALGLGAAALVVSVATGVSAQRDRDAYAHTQVDTAEQADVALAHFDRAEHKAQVAQVLGGTSAGLLALGAALVLWGRFGGKEDRNLHTGSSKSALLGARTLRVSALPTSTGAMMSLRAEL